MGWPGLLTHASSTGYWNSLSVSYVLQTQFCFVVAWLIVMKQSAVEYMSPALSPTVKCPWDVTCSVPRENARVLWLLEWDKKHDIRQHIGTSQAVHCIRNALASKSQECAEKCSSRRRYSCPLRNNGKARKIFISDSLGIRQHTKIQIYCPWQYIVFQKRLLFVDRRDRPTFNCSAQCVYYSILLWNYRS